MLMKTTVPRLDQIRRGWFLVDGSGKTVGRLAVKIANVLRGRNAPIFTPHVDTGHFVVVINAEKVKFTGQKESQKTYTSYSGYRGGLRKTPVAMVRQKHPERILAHAVKGMLPHNHMSREIIKRLKIYAGTVHPHTGQNPQPIDL